MNFYEIGPKVLHERLDGEVVALDMSTGRYFSLSGPAADVWFLLSSEIHESRWPQTLIESYSSSTDFVGLENFLVKLEAEGLIKRTTKTEHKGEVLALPNDYQRNSWTAPELFVYDDLSDLILIDPVHE